MLRTGQEEMQRPVEIEFAGMIDKKGDSKGRLYWLQIRPIVDRKENVDESVMNTPDDRLLLKFGVAYFTIDTAKARKSGSDVGDIYDVAFLDSLPAIYESDYIRIVTFPEPLSIGVNGLKGTGVVVKP